MKSGHILLLGLFVFLSCTGDDIEKPIELSSYSIKCFAGSEYVIDVLSDTKNLALLDQDPDIASGWWINKSRSVLIKCESVGETSVFIKDRDDVNKYAEIKVTSEFLSGNFVVEQSDKANIIVNASDKSIKSEIEKDLSVLANSRSGTFYSFEKETKSVQIDRLCNGQKDRITGYYDWNKDSLHIHVNGITDKYAFGVIDDSSVIIESNLLETYKRKYPDATILTVRLGLFLSKH